MKIFVYKAIYLYYIMILNFKGRGTGSADGCRRNREVKDDCKVFPSNQKHEISIDGDGIGYEEMRFRARGT